MGQIGVKTDNPKKYNVKKLCCWGCIVYGQSS